MKPYIIIFTIKMEKNKYVILINTCDKYEDCWMPFFKLWSLYWKNYNGTIYLNTEYINFNYPGLNIKCTKCCDSHGYPKNKKAPWSQCLIWALEEIETELVLYMQEDYFLKGNVKEDIIASYANIMEKNEYIKCIHLTDQSVITDGESEYPHLCNVKKWQRFRASCQAAIWRKQELLEILRPYENAWDFEEFGSKRSAKIGHRYLAVNPNWVKINEFEILPYIFTGIIQGKWYYETIPLFKAHNIYVDFSKRGIVKGYSKRSKYENAKFQIRRFFVKVRNKWEMFRI